MYSENKEIDIKWIYYRSRCVENYTWHNDLDCIIQLYYIVKSSQSFTLSFMSVSNSVINLNFYYTSTKSWRCFHQWNQLIQPFLHLHEIVEGLYFHCSLSVCVCVSVCVSVRLNSCEQNSNRTDEPIWTQFSLNGCLEHWLKPYWNWWPWSEVQGHSDSISIFSS